MRRAPDPGTLRRLLLTRFPLVDGHPDVAGVLRDPGSLALLGPALAAPFRDAGITKVLAPEARGPIVPTAPHSQNPMWFVSSWTISDTVRRG